jgi:YhcH/YjgK/YiaL family protein
MILTDFEHVDRQVPLTPSLRKALDFLERNDISTLPDGRTDIDGDRVFALVQRYETVRTDAPKFEYHRKYIDVQFIVSGEEMIGWAPAGTMRVAEAYEPEKDICFGIVEAGKWTAVRLEAGQLMVLWPEDAHAPKGAAGAPSLVMKIVVKVAV